MAVVSNVSSKASSTGNSIIVKVMARVARSHRNCNSNDTCTSYKCCKTTSDLEGERCAAIRPPHTRANRASLRYAEGLAETCYDSGSAVQDDLMGVLQLSTHSFAPLWPASMRGFAY